MPTTRSISIDLPDINVLLALHDVSHPDHDRALRWLGAAPERWATCPLTENGFVRILSSGALPSGGLSPDRSLQALNALIAFIGRIHEFWPDEISLRDTSLFHPPAISGHRQITDVYLLGLCQKRGGTLVTLDKRITTEAIVAPHLHLLRTL